RTARVLRGRRSRGGGDPGMRRSFLLLLLAVATACSSASSGRTPAPAAVSRAPFDAPPAAAHAVEIEIDSRAAREILESLSRPRFEPTDARLLQDLPAVHLTVQDSKREPEVFERDMAAAFEEKSRATVFDFWTIRQERDRWRALLSAIASREKELARMARQRASALLPGDRAVSGRVRVHLSCDISELAAHHDYPDANREDTRDYDLTTPLERQPG